MKSLSLIILIPALMLSALNATSQNVTTSIPVDPDTKLITYKEVVTVAGTPAELFNRAIEWVNKEYKNPMDATKIRNQATGLIEIIHRIELTKDVDGTKLLAGIVDYSMKLELKDGRYRYTITNFNLKDVSRKPIEFWMDTKDKTYIPLYADYLKQVDDFTRKLIESLKTGMQPPAPKKVDEW
ncbi:MAG: DUF4468 domain-containing protein [Bacteroidota bacterium]